MKNNLYKKEEQTQEVIKYFSKNLLRDFKQKQNRQ